MLGVHPASSMPHAVTRTSLRTSWPHKTASSDLDSFTRLPLPRQSKPITLPQDMNGPASVYRDAMNPNFQTASGLASMSSGYGSIQKSVYAGSTEPSYYSTNGLNSGNRVHTPESRRTFTIQPERDSQQSTTSSSAPSIPNTIQVPQAELSQLAAEVACLLWFETGSVLEPIEKGRSTSNLSLSPNVVPAEGFRKWLSGLLQTTQVAQNVIILALLFIYRLKRINPSVIGNIGSEFRLMTVALMLGNKYLDDNTYTNKTWAEVSGISVQEVHTMEVEFLSNMRFSLFTTESTWMQWHEKLSKFGMAVDTFVKSQEAATKLMLLAPLQSPTKPQSPLSPYSTNTLPYLGSNLAQTSTPVLMPQISSTAISPIGSLPELGYNRKRMLEDTTQESPAKRIHADYPTPLSVSSAHNLLPPPATASSTLRMNLPSLTIPSLSPGSALPQIPHSLPAPGSRAMSLIYPSIQQRTPTSQMIPPIQTTVTSTPGMSALDPVRQLSPYQMSQNSSPISANPLHLSPSYFLGQRSSPYRPVRQVKTLLVPPRAPTSIYNAPRQVGLDHLQYHSLGQPLNERHVGHVPYMHRDAWPQTNQPPQWPPLTRQHEVTQP